MIITLSFVNGFQQTVSQKVFSFWGHIRVQHYEEGKVLVAEESPILKNDTIEAIIKQQKGIAQIQVFATKSAVLEKNKEIEGILFKGVDPAYDSLRLKQFIKEGRWLQFNDSNYNKEIIVSAPIANSLKLHVSDTVRITFISQDLGKITYRKLLVVGIYKTGIEEYDKLFAIGDIRLIRRINDWQPNEIGGYELFVNDYTKMDTINAQLLDKLPNIWISKTIRDVYPNIFDWLNIQDVNRNVIFIVMAIVAVINLITCLLILVLERTSMVGILKAIGANDWNIQKIFLYHASFITITGIGMGLILGLIVCFLQQQFGFIRLDETNYYVSTAPIQIIWWQIAAICVSTTLVCFVSLIIPTFLVKNINPVKSIQFR